MPAIENPLALVWLLLVPLAVSLRHSGLLRGSRLELSLEYWNGPRHPAASGRLRLLKSACDTAFGLGFILVVLATSNPGWSTQEEVFLDTPATLLFVLDESPSMVAQDTPAETRFDASRRVIERFVRSVRGVQLGLVTFAQNAALRVAPTLDYSTFLARLWELEPASLGFGTAIGLGLAFGALALEEAPGQRILVLITDGKNNAGEVRPDTAARALSALGIRFYVIGIGTQARVPAVLRDPRTGQFLAGTIEDSYDEDELRRLAALGEGAFFQAQSSSVLESVLRAIESREIRGRRSTVQVHFQSWQRPLALLAALSLSIWVLLRGLVLKELL